MATPSRTVQFRNVNDVLEAYSNCGIPDFAIWSGKQLMFPFKCEDVDEGCGLLEALLIKLKNSSAIYTLCVYKNVKEDILSSTPFNASFNFQLKQLRDGDGNYLNDFNANTGVNNEILSRLEGLALTVSELQRRYDEEVEVDESDGLGFLGKVLEHPTIAAVVKGIFNDKLIPKNVGMGNVPVDNDRLGAVIEKLKVFDPDIILHLEKLADIATKDPNGFKMLLTYLDGM